MSISLKSLLSSAQCCSSLQECVSIYHWNVSHACCLFFHLSFQTMRDLLYASLGIDFVQEKHFQESHRSYQSERKAFFRNGVLNLAELKLLLDIRSPSQVSHTGSLSLCPVLSLPEITNDFPLFQGIVLKMKGVYRDGPTVTFPCLYETFI